MRSSLSRSRDATPPPGLSTVDPARTAPWVVSGARGEGDEGGAGAVVSRNLLLSGEDPPGVLSIAPLLGVQIARWGVCPLCPMACRAPVILPSSTRATVEEARHTGHFATIAGARMWHNVTRRHFRHIRALKQAPGGVHVTRGKGGGGRGRDHGPQILSSIWWSECFSSATLISSPLFIRFSSPLVVGRKSCRSLSTASRAAVTSRRSR
jgi:hypothetical protein